jgi:hypothetical protein
VEFPRQGVGIWVWELGVSVTFSIPFWVLLLFIYLFPCFYGKEIIILVQRLMDLLEKLQFDHVIIHKYPINLIFVIWGFGLSRNI